jgi:hypothetical protein
LSTVARAQSWAKTEDATRSKSTPVRISMLYLS